MKRWWLKFGCFLTGYNYNILLGCSEVAARAVKRYTAAMIIICILWAFVGFSFTQRYLKGGVGAAVFGAAVLVVVIVQIERQIILTAKSRLTSTARLIIALAMALIGTVILDQILYKDDIELNKMATLNARVDALMPKKTAELSRQIGELDSAISIKEKERMLMLVDIGKHPRIQTVSSTTTKIKTPTNELDSLENRPKTKTTESTTKSLSSMPNPKIDLINPINQFITTLQAQKAQKDSVMLALRPQLEKEIISKTGLLDELQALYNIISNSGVAFFFWSVLLLFLLGLELLVLLCKHSDKGGDYDDTIGHQMDLGRKKLAVLAKSGEKQVSI